MLISASFHESESMNLISKASFWKGDCAKVLQCSIQCSNLRINQSTPQTQSNFIWISSKAELEISFFNSLLEK